jgi:PAS domain S-box-containing protein
MEQEYSKLKEELQTQKDRFQTLLNSTPDGYLLLDTKGFVVDVNNSYIQMSGYTKDELIGESIDNIDLTKTPYENNELIQEVKSKGHLVFETKHKHKNEESFDAEISVSYSSLEDGLLFTLIRDISDRKKEEKRLKDEQFLLETIINTIPVRIFWKDLDGRYLGANKLFLNDASLKHESEIIGKNDFEMVWKKEAELYRADDKEVMFSSKSKLNIIERQTHLDGKEIIVDTSKVPLKDTKGDVTGVIGVYRDITDEYAISSSLKESRDDLESIFKVARDGIVIIDLETNFLKVNDAFANINGYSREELMTLSCFTLTPEEDREKSKKVIATVLEQGYYNNFEKLCTRKDGKLIYMNLSLALMPDKKRIIVNAKDITAKKEYELQLLKSKSLLEDEVEARTEALTLMQQNYQRFINNLGREFVIYSIDVNTDEVLFISEASEKIFGYKPYEFAGYLWHDIIDWDEDSRLKSYENINILKEEKSDFTYALLSFKKPDGTYKIVQQTSYSVKDANGKCIKIDGIVEDVTEYELAAEKYRRFIKNFGSDFVIYSYNPDTHILSYISEASEKIIGIKYNEMIGKSWVDLIKWDADSLQIAFDSNQKIFNGVEDSNQIVVSFYKENGEKRICKATSFAIRDKDGECVSIDGIMEDITDQVNATLKLEESEQFSRNIMEGAADAIVTINEFGIIQAFNKAAEQLFGYDRDEAIGKNVNLLVPNPYHDNHDKYLQNYLQTGVKKAIGTTAELSAIRKDGSEFPASIRIGEIKTDNRRIFTALIQDISTRKAYENAIIRSKEEAESAARMKSDFLANMSHEIRTPMNAIIGMSHLLLDTDLDDKQLNYMTKVYRSSELLLNIINDILDMSKIDSGQLNIENISFNLDTVLEDITDAVSLSLKKKRIELTYWVDTDVPLNLIGDPMRLRQILLNLINNAIKFTKEKEGDIVLHINIKKLEKDSIVLHISVEDNGIGMSKEQQDKLFQAFVQADASTTRNYGGTGLGLVISKRLVEMMDGKIWVDSRLNEGSTFHFTATFGIDNTKDELLDENILGNRNILFVDDNKSIRAMIEATMKRSGLNIEIAANAYEALKIIIKSTHGIDLIVTDWKMHDIDGVDLIKVIRNEDDLVKQPEVLVLSGYQRSLVENAFEGLDVNYYLEKPFCLSSLNDKITEIFMKSSKYDLENIPLKNSSKESFKQLCGAYILLAEDNEINKELTIDLLDSVGVSAVVASNGQEVLDRLKEDEFDGILMDCQMPVMDGYEATRRIREDEKYKDLPIIALTANAMTEDFKRSIDAGMNDQVNKPIRPDDLFAAMTKWITPSKPIKEDNQVSTEDEVSDSYEDSMMKKLKSISELDIQSAMITTQNNLGLYIRILRKFLNSQRNFRDRFQKAISSSDKSAPQREAHTLKGIAGNIGADELYKLSQELENACMQEYTSSEIELKVKKVEESLTKLLNSLKFLKDEVVSDKKSDETIEVEKAIGLIEESSNLAQSYDTDAIKVFQELKEVNGIMTYSDIVLDIQNYLEKYAFDEANEMLEKLKKEILNEK